VRLVALLALSPVACAGVIRWQGTPDDVARHEQEMSRLESELYAQTAQAQPPHCARITTLCDNICVLADRICQIADRHHKEPGIQKRCDDAFERCLRANAAAKQRGCAR
jgi:hypothetical protein